MSSEAWSARYELGIIPWDLGRPHPELDRRLAIDPSLGCGEVGRALVPGAGRGHDAAALAAAGWVVTALDYAASLESHLRPLVEPTGGTVEIADALSWEGDTFDLIFDHTFFCAVDPGDRPLVGNLVDRHLASAGHITSIVFPIGRPHSEGGPPWGYAVDDMDRALGAGFHRVEASEESRMSGRRWPYRWASWERATP